MMPFAALHFFYDEPGCFAFIKSGLSVVAYALQGIGQVFLYEGVAGFPGTGFYKGGCYGIVFDERLRGCG